MALPSPVADFPDMSALVQQNMARSDSLMNAAWAQMRQGNAEQAQKTAQAQAVDEATRRAEQFQASGFAGGLEAWGQPGQTGQPGNTGATGSTGAAGSASALAPANSNSAMAPFLPLLDKYEGGGRYDTLFGHAQREGGRFAGVDVTKMTLGQLRQFTDVNGEYGQWVKNQLAKSGQRARVATPMGRHQIVGTTLFNAAKALGLSDDTVFSDQVQDTIAAHLARQRLASANTMEGKIAGLRAEWEGFKHVPDQDLIAAIQQFQGA